MRLSSRCPLLQPLPYLDTPSPLTRAPGVFTPTRTSAVLGAPDGIRYWIIISVASRSASRSSATEYEAGENTVMYCPCVWSERSRSRSWSGRPEEPRPPAAFPALA